MIKRLSATVLPACLLIAGLSANTLVGQGLSGVQQRLDETIQQSRSGGDPSSLPGYGGGSNAPSGEGQSGEEMRRGGGGSSSVPGANGGSSSPPAGGQEMRGYGGGSSSPPGLSPGGPGGMSLGSAGIPGGGDREMEDDPDFQMQGYGGSGGPGQGQTGGAGNNSNAYTAGLASVFGSMNLSELFFPNKEINVQSGPILKNESEEAFKAGHYAMARELFFAYLATEYDKATFDLQDVRYSSLLKRPTWNIRWGVSMSVRGDDVENASPVKEGARPAGGLASAGGRGPGGFGTGDEGFDESMSRDDFAGGGADMEMEMQDEMGGFGGPGGPGGFGAPGGFGGPDGFGRGGQPGGGNVQDFSSSIPERKMLSDKAKEELSGFLGLVEVVVAEEFKKRFQQGHFGPLLTTVNAPVIPEAKPNNGGFNAQTKPPVAPPTMTMELNDALLESGDPLYPMWLPGISYLGQVDSSETAIAIAEEQKIDLILHFDISLKLIRGELVQNVSRCRLLHVSPPADSQGRKRHQLITSKGIDNLESQQLAATERMTEREYVNEQLSAVWLLIDRDIKVIDLPELTADVAKRRLATLLAGTNSKSLQTLAEARYYQSMNLINQADAETVFQIAGEEDGLILLHGPLKQRIEVSRKWAVDAARQTDDG